MKSRQKIKALKLTRMYDRRGKKYNDKSLIYFFSEWQDQSLRHITSQCYESRKSLKKYRNGLKMKTKIITNITDYEDR